MSRGFSDLAIALSLCVVVVIVVGVANLTSFAKCSSRGRLMGPEYSWGPVQGCMVKYRGHWLPIEAIREIGLGGTQ